MEEAIHSLVHLLVHPLEVVEAAGSKILHVMRVLPSGAVSNPTLFCCHSRMNCSFDALDSEVCLRRGHHAEDRQYYYPSHRRALRCCIHGRHPAEALLLLDPVLQVPSKA